MLNPSLPSRSCARLAQQLLHASRLGLLQQQRAASSGSRVVGIDLGTTQSVVAVLEGRKPRVLPDASGRATVPSIVAYTSDGILVGQPARAQAALNPAATFAATKRLMGRRFDDPQSQTLRRSASYPVVQAANSEAWLQLPNGQEVPPAVVSRFLQLFYSQCGMWCEVHRCFSAEE